MYTFNGGPSAVIPPEELLNTTQQLILLDCRPFEDYEFCHLDGAIHVDIDSALSSATEPGHDPAKGGRNPLPKNKTWEKQLRQWGVRQDSTVVAYDNAFGAEGAARAWWMLAASGIKAAILDGGWDAAIKAHLPISEEVPLPAPSAIEFTDWLLPTLDIEAVAKLHRNPEWLLLDSRAPERWRGEIEPFDPIPGHIPGSINVHFKENLKDGRFKQPEELRSMYMQIFGGIPPGRVIASCGSGMTACHTLLALHHAGLDGASLFVGSYSEWCRNRPEP
ncbi:MAG: sulfurtransferase [Holophagaceae bacterium]|nr:sulfurtransferase [Holophagaceae bacterium]